MHATYHTYRVLFQQQTDQLLGGTRDSCRNGVSQLLDALVRDSLAFCSARQASKLRSCTHNLGVYIAVNTQRTFTPWCNSGQELECQDSNGPDVHIVIVNLTSDHFRRKVVKRPASGLALHGDSVRRPAKVSNFKLTITPLKQIFWFEIAVNDVLGMEIVKCVAELADVPGRKLEAEPVLRRGQFLVEFSTLRILKDQEDSLGVVKPRIHPQDIFVSKVTLNFNFGPCQQLKTVTFELAFRQHFDGDDEAGALLTREKDMAKLPSTEFLAHVKVIEAHPTLEGLDSLHLTDDALRLLMRFRVVGCQRRRQCILCSFAGHCWQDLSRKQDACVGVFDEKNNNVHQV